ncbi:TPA_asm: hypothetical protein [ssRNA phage ESO001]|uniref:Uncharacterized protein n=1 Tax=ssRNA phage ESO001 TaxID=2786008 RepID=A0A8S5KXD9_9VIRU|nr:hypothetical protein QIN35_gp3 [ssRNA phage ESO001]DAD49921.1 TPA_asm: hypothetical protein [ssRNA phage ESO001]
MKNSYKTTRQMKNLNAYLNGLEGHFGHRITNRKKILNMVFCDSDFDYIEYDFYNHKICISELSYVKGELRNISYVPEVVMSSLGVLSFERPPGLDDYCHNICSPNSI